MKALILLLIFVCFCSLACAETIDMSIIAKIESNNNPFAYNWKTKAMGLYQITPICLKEYNNFHKDNYNLLSLFDCKINHKVASWYLNVRIPQMLQSYNKSITLENILISYNAGINYVVKDLPLKRETKNYIEKYKGGN